MIRVVLTHSRTGLKLTLMTNAQSIEELQANIAVLLQESGLTMRSAKEWKANSYSLWPRKS